MVRTVILLLGLMLCGVFGGWAWAHRSSSPTAASSETILKAYTTAYTYWDNTPPGSSIIAFAKKDTFPTVHDEAGGQGTYDDPITLAVGHVLAEATDTPDFLPGTRFYVPVVRRYFIVEDTCGDGDRPQDIPCHKAEEGDLQVDLWIDGHDGTAEQVDACASALTEIHTIIKDPAPDYVVVPGALFQNGTCTLQYGEEAKKK